MITLFILFMAAMWGFVWFAIGMIVMDGVFTPHEPPSLLMNKRGIILWVARRRFEKQFYSRLDAICKEIAESELPKNDARRYIAGL